MASMFKLLFDTMLFDATLGTCGPQRSARSLDNVTISEFAGYTHFDKQPGTRRHYEVTAADRAGPPEEVPIWEWTASTDPSVFTDVTCKVSGDDFKEYVVLDKLEFGSGFGGAGFEPSVRVSLAGKVFSLPLNEDARLASFSGWGRTNGMHPLWRLQSETDCSELHVMAYDLDIVAGTVTPLTRLPAGHPEAADMAKFMMSCHRLAYDSTDESQISETLFGDDLWNPLTELVAGAIGGLPGGATKELMKIIELRALTVRVLVVTSLTLCQERDDYQPGSPAGVGRLYPHVMVRATAPLDHVDATVRFTRPTSTTIKNGHLCGCSEMNDDMGALFVTDAERGNLQDGPSFVPSIETPSLPGLPPSPVFGATRNVPNTFWNNLFNYYLKDAHEKLGNVDVHVVRHAGRAKSLVDGPIQRRRDDPDTAHKITRGPRQGAFDNIHMSPTMRLPSVAKIRSLDGKEDIVVDADVRARWSFDRVHMAPFCVHDCFHMHWRWTDNLNTQRATFGFENGMPSAVPGRPMVPENQDVDVQIVAKNAFLYKARAHTASADSWQVFCHHGAGYLLSERFSAELARVLMSNVFVRAGTRDWSGVRLDSLVGSEITPAQSWAIFYWHMQFYVDERATWPPTKPNDRVVIDDLQAILDF